MRNNTFILLKKAITDSNEIILIINNIHNIINNVLLNKDPNILAMKNLMNKLLDNMMIINHFFDRTRYAIYRINGTGIPAPPPP